MTKYDEKTDALLSEIKEYINSRVNTEDYYTIVRMKDLYRDICTLTHNIYQIKNSKGVNKKFKTLISQLVAKTNALSRIDDIAWHEDRMPYESFCLSCYALGHHIRTTIPETEVIIPMI